jgi:hypothetical protein
VFPTVNYAIKKCPLYVLGMGLLTVEILMGLMKMPK